MATGSHKGTVTFLGALTWIFLSSCSADPSDLLDEVVQISFDSASLEHRVESGSINGSLAISIRNEGMANIWFAPCGSVLERDEGADWVSVWHAICLLSVSEVEIKPGEVYATEVMVNAGLGRGPSKSWTPPLGGSYRIHLSIRDQRRVLAHPSSTSDPFDLRPTVVE